MAVGARVAIFTIVITTAVRARHETVSSEKRQKFLLSWFNNQNNQTKIAGSEGSPALTSDI